MPDTLPEPDAYGPSADYSERTEPHYRADTVRRLLAEVRRQALEDAARWVDRRRDAFCDEHGSIDPDTNALEFGRGLHAEAKQEHVGELEEISEGLRALKDKP